MRSGKLKVGGATPRARLASRPSPALRERGDRTQSERWVRVSSENRPSPALGLRPEAPSPAVRERGEQPSPSISLPRIFAAFLRLGCTAFGGGMAAWLYRDIVLKRRWLDEATFLSDFALGQAIPGSNGIKLTVQIGQRLHGAAGAAVALVGLLVGPFIAIVLAI